MLIRTVRRRLYDVFDRVAPRPAPAKEVEPLPPPAPDPGASAVAHVFQSYRMDPDTTRRVAVAERSWRTFLWSRGDVAVRPFTPAAATRTARTALGTSSDIPFVNDLFDSAVPHGRTILFTNTDVGFFEDPVPAVTPLIERYGCCYSARIDFHEPLTEPPPRPQRSQGVYPGADMMCFSRDWWLAVRASVPVMIIGREGWDYVMKRTMERSGFRPPMLPPQLFHEHHVSAWWRTRHVQLRSPEQVYNRAVCAAWAEANGFAADVSRDRRGPLFRGDGKDSK
jgi:hypothetical protein